MSNTELEQICATCKYDTARQGVELMEKNIKYLESQIESMQRRLNNAKVFFHCVAKMRKAQINYFKTRATGYLDESKALEKQVDTIIDNALNKAKQLNINF